MIKKTAKLILKNLQHKEGEYAVRDITVLTSSIFGEAHFSVLEKNFGAKFSMIFWCVKEDGNVIFYRSGDEYNNFSKKVGNSFIKDIRKAKDVSNTLIKMSDEINNFIKNNYNLQALVLRWNSFYILYRDFFAYHQAVYWSSVYLSKKDKDRKIEKILNILDQAYKYNEKVIPNVEEYFNNLKIGHLLYNEINKNVSNNIKVKPKKRSTLFLRNRRFQAIPIVIAKKINRMIQDDYKKYLKNIKNIIGLAVSKGRVIGRARIITNLKYLKDVKRGEVLVTTQTRPQYNNVLVKTKAIITDEGGLLCHASMLAREFRIPCIVGTKIATKVLHNGDLVEVDANEGIVKIKKKK